MSRIETLPPELWSLVIKNLQTGDLANMMLVNRYFANVAVRELYRCPQFKPLATVEHWRGFVDRMINNTGIFPYADIIEACDDIWLFVGGEYRDDELDMDEDLSRELFPKYSICHFLNFMMNNKKIKEIKIHFYSELIRFLPWNVSLRNLTRIEMGPRVTDKMLTSIFGFDHNASSLKYLIFHQAEISDVGVKSIGQKAKGLEELCIFITPMSKRCKYRHDIDESTFNFITGDALKAMFLRLTKLKSVQIRNAPVSCTVYSPLKEMVKCLSLTLCEAKNSTSDTFWSLLKGFNKLQYIEICGSLEKDAPFSDTVLDEQFVLNLPAITTLSKIKLNNLDIFRNERNCYKYYGLKNCSWELDSFRMNFKAAFPHVTLEIGQ